MLPFTLVVYNQAEISVANIVLAVNRPRQIDLFVLKITGLFITMRSRYSALVYYGLQSWVDSKRGHSHGIRILRTVIYKNKKRLTGSAWHLLLVAEKSDSLSFLLLPLPCLSRHRKWGRETHSCHRQRNIYTFCTRTSSPVYSTVFAESAPTKAVGTVCSNPGLLLQHIFNIQYLIVLS